MTTQEKNFGRVAATEIQSSMGFRARLSRALRRINLGSFFTLRTKLVILVIIAIAPIVGERIRGLEVGRADRFKMAGVQMQDLAHHAADVQVQMLRSVQSTMNAVAATQALPADAQSATCGQALAQIADADEFIENLSIASTSGRVLCANQPALVGLNAGERGFFRRALKDRSFSISNILNSRQFKQPIIAVALPKLSADGAAEFVVIATLQLTWLETTIAKLANRPNTSAFVIDGTGNVIARSPRRDGLVGQNFASLPLVRDVLSGAMGPFSTKDFDGVVRRFAAVKLDRTGGYFAVGVDENAVLANINRQVGIAYWVIAGAIIMVLLAAWFGGDRIIIRPMRALVEKAVRFGDGDYSAIASKVRIPSDFVPLDHALDRMAEQLASREQSLKEENRQLDLLAQFDGLTGLPNRRSFDATLQSQWNGSEATEQLVSLLMIDIDHFKRFNDYYGHVEGDACLKTIATCLAEGSLRPSDVVARYGGEEFAAVLPPVSLERAVAIAERVRQAVFDLNLPNRQAPVGRVTISVGAATVSTHAATSRELVEAADAALYTAKRSGRNRVSAITAEMVLAAG
jgi:diguanylate cyclase (GGDEF)-like protein